MCTISDVGDGYRNNFYDRYPKQAPQKLTSTGLPPITMGVPQEDFDKLKVEVEELKLLLLAAKRFDEKTGQPNCETDDKVAFIKQLATMLDVDMDEVFGK